MEYNLNQLDRSFRVPFYEEKANAPACEIRLTPTPNLVAPQSEKAKMELDVSYPSAAPRVSHQVFKASVLVINGEQWPKVHILSDGSAIIQHRPLGFAENVTHIIQNWIGNDSYPTKLECFAFLDRMFESFSKEAIL